MGYYIYCRISRDMTGEGNGVARQERECREFAETHGLTVDEVFIDNDVSAFSGVERPAFKDMLNRLKARQGEGIITWHIDRLFRRTAELEEIVNLVEETDIQVRTIKAGDINLNTATGRMFARMSATLANYEVDHQIERIRASHTSRALAGMWRGGNYPFGYGKGEKTGTLRLIEDEAQDIRLMANELEGGATLMAIARRLNEQGSTTRRGKPWSAVTISKLLKGGIIAGLNIHNGTIIGKGQWDPIIEEDQWHRINAILSDPRRRTNQGLERKWQGSGVYKCGLCGGSIGVHTYRKNGRKYRSYLCLDCNKISRAQYRVDDLVDAVVLGYLDKPENRLKVAQQSDGGGEGLAPLLDKRRSLVSRKNNAGTMYASGKIDDGQLLAITNEIDSQLQPLDRRISEARESSPTLGLVLAGEGLRERWDELPADKRALVIRELVEVTILPAKRGAFDPNSVRIEWK